METPTTTTTTTNSPKKSAAATMTAADTCNTVSQATESAAAPATTTPPLLKKRLSYLPKVTKVTQKDDNLDSDEEWNSGLMDFNNDNDGIATTNDTANRPAARLLTPDSPPCLDLDPDIQMEVLRHLETLAEDDNSMFA